MSRTLLRGGCVLTLGRVNHPEADVLIDGETIVEVGPGIRARDAELVDVAGSIVMPGFVDAHRHAWETLFRHAGVGAAPERIGPYFSPDDVYAGTLIGLLGAIDAGITSVVDWSGVGGGDDHVEAALQAHADSGARTVFVHGSSPWAGDAWKARLGRVAGAAGPLLTPAAGPPEPRRGDPDPASTDWAAAREAGLRLHVHAGSSPGSSGSVAELAGRGLLGPDVTLIHCSYLDDLDLDAIASTDTGVVSTPVSEMVGGIGSPSIQRLMDRGIRPGLGVDTERLGSPTDMFAQMRAVISLQHGAMFELKLGGKASLPKLMTTREVIRLATVDAARSAGFDDAIGTLEPGKQADLIVLSADGPNIHPINDPIGAVVWGMDTSNVDWVFVAGRAVKRDGEVAADIGRARRLAIEAHRRVGEASGILVGAGGSG